MQRYALCVSRLGIDLYIKALRAVLKPVLHTKIYVRVLRRDALRQHQHEQHASTTQHHWHQHYASTSTPPAHQFGLPWCDSPRHYQCDSQRFYQYDVPRHHQPDDSTSFARRPPALGDTYAILHEYAALRAICIQL